MKKFSSLTLILMCAGLFISICYSLTGQSSRAKIESVFQSSPDFSIFVEPGIQNDSVAYYTRIQKKMAINLLDQAGSPVGTLDQLIAHFGYAGLSANDFEKLISSDLMPNDTSSFNKLSNLVSDPIKFKNNLKLDSFSNDNVLVSRFFAPKIVDYSVAEPFTPGWRKLVKLNALPGSVAASANLESISILFNYVNANANVDPFINNLSKNNQVIIIPKTFNPATEDSAFFMVYLEGPVYALGFALEGVAFDLPQLGVAKYFVPSSCAQCHGHDRGAGNFSPKPADGIFRAARLNYLDTDQWLDMLNYDFQNVAQSSNGVIFDGGKDTNSQTYKSAFGVIRRLNQYVYKQNLSVNANDFKTKAAEKWLSVHINNDLPLSMENRILSLGADVWDISKPDELELLNKLNRYCFRCHSSIRYNIFDKQGVKKSSSGMQSRMEELISDKRYMPNGRILTLAERDRMIELINRIFP
jgi:hypothetical protein